MMKILFVCYILLSIPVWCMASAVDKFYHSIINSVDGLSNGGINYIFQDIDGMMWFSTWDGLNRYDGREIKVYKSNPKDSCSLADNIIKGIVQRHSGELWVESHYALNRIDLKTKQVTRFFYDLEEKHTVDVDRFRIACGNNVFFCLVRGENLYYYRDDIKKFESLFTRSVDVSSLVDIYCDVQGNIWGLDYEGNITMFVVAKDSKGSLYIEGSISKLEGVHVDYLFSKRTDEFWIIDNNAQLYRYSPSDNNLLFVMKINLSYPDNNIIRDIERVDNDYYVSTQREGVIKYKFINGRIESHKIYEQECLSMFYDDKQQIMWLGTNGMGVIKRYMYTNKFRNIKNEDLFEDDRNWTVRAIYKDKTGSLLVGSRGNGLIVMSESDGKLSNRVQLLDDKSVLSICSGPEDISFIGTEFDGIYYINSKKPYITNSLITRQQGNFSSSVYSMHWDSKRSVLWVGTMCDGLLKLYVDRQNSKMEVLRMEQFVTDSIGGLSNNSIFAIIPENDNRLWLATRGGGINIFDVDTGVVNVYSSKSEPALLNNDVLCLKNTADSLWWAGTSYGLTRLKIKNGKCVETRHYTEDSGFPNNTIHGILEDGVGNLWLSTNKGISKFIPQTEQIVNYNILDNILNEEFTDGAYFTDNEGKMYFGSVSGITLFSPFSISERIYQAPLVLTDFWINNKELDAFSRVKTDGQSNRIELRHDENFFSVRCVSLDYINNGNCLYKYKLEGFNNYWINGERNNVASFTNVPPGRYILKIRGTNGDKVWTDNILDIDIWIHLPWWNRWWAYLIYFLVFSISSYAVYMMIRKRMLLNRALRMERLERIHQEEITDAKLQFFINIVHEFSTPLTLIYGPCMRLKHMVLDDKQNRYIDIIKSNAERMTRLIKELMEFHKAEKGYQSLRYEKVDVYDIIHCIEEDYLEFREESGIKFTVECDTSVLSPDGTLIWITDRGCIEKIIFNIISNAFKYVNNNGVIIVRILIENDNLIIRVRNTGNGILPEDLDKIFNRFYILNNFENKFNDREILRNGIGLALTKSLVTLLNGEINVSSQPSEYTEFTIKFPAVNEGLCEQSNVESSLQVSDKEDSFSENALINDILTSEDTSRPLILAIDDNKQIIDLLKDVFSESYRFVGACDGKEALNLIKIKRPSLIISDIIMPNMDGMSLLDELKNNRLTNHIPIVFLSSKIDYELQISAYKRGLETFISKPFNPQHLLAVVENIIRNQQTTNRFDAMSSVVNENYCGDLSDVDDVKFITKVTETIENNIEVESFNAEMLSKELAISYISLYRRIKELCGMTPSAFIKKIRLKRAAYMLKSRKVSVQEIVYSCGFNNRSYFYREFTKEYGVSPKNYANNDSQLPNVKV